MASDIQAIKDWLVKQPHLQNIRNDDKFIQFFLRGCKYSIERTKEKLDFFNSVRSALPEWFDDWDKIDGSIAILKAGASFTLNGFDKKGRRVFFWQMGKINPEEHKLEDLYRLHFILMEIIMDEMDQSSVTGFITANNCKGATLSHVAMMSNPVTMKKSATVLQDAYPLRPKCMHMLNMPGLMDNILTMFKSFMNDKMKDRIQHYPMDDFSAFVEDCGIDVLPEELGGSNGKIQDHIDYTVNLIESKRDWLKAQTAFKADEAKRPGKPKNYSDIFGMEGSFRQLNVD